MGRRAKLCLLPNIVSLRPANLPAQFSAFVVFVPLVSPQHNPCRSLLSNTTSSLGNQTRKCVVPHSPPATSITFPRDCLVFDQIHVPSVINLMRLY